MFMQHNGTESITATILSQWEHVCCYISECQWYYCRTPPLHFLHKHTHAYIHASTLWCTYTRWLCLYSLVHSFEEPPPLNGWLNIFRSNNLSQVLRVALVSRLLYARDALYRSPCVTLSCEIGPHTFSCVNKYSQFSLVGFWLGRCCVKGGWNDLMSLN